jgi:hypothetical protein
MAHKVATLHVGLNGESKDPGAFSLPQFSHTTRLQVPGAYFVGFRPPHPLILVVLFIIPCKLYSMGWLLPWPGIPVPRIPGPHVALQLPNKSEFLPSPSPCSLSQDTWVLAHPFRWDLFFFVPRTFPKGNKQVSYI